MVFQQGRGNAEGQGLPAPYLPGPGQLESLQFLFTKVYSADYRVFLILPIRVMLLRHPHVQQFNHPCNDIPTGLFSLRITAYSVIRALLGAREWKTQFLYFRDKLHSLSLFLLWMCQNYSTASCFSFELQLTLSTPRLSHVFMFSPRSLYIT